MDPQTLSETEARLIVQNVMEGLVTIDKNGQIIPGVAESYEVSQDGLIYTFSLRKDAAWVDYKAQFYANVTADDFVFAFRRIFDRETASPFANDFACILNSSLVASGQVGSEQIGVKAIDGQTLEIRLKYQNPDFLSLLASPAAMPCNKDFFDSTDAHYGLDARNLLYNGPFYIGTYSEEKYIYAEKNSAYVSSLPCVAESVLFRVLQEGESSFQRFSEGSNDALILAGAQIEFLGAEDYNISAYEDSVWIICLNMLDKVLADKKIRQSLALSLDREKYSQNDMPSWMSPASSLIPSIVTVGGESYSQTSGAGSALKYSPSEARRLFNAGLEENNLSALPKTTLIYPENEAYTHIVQQMQKSWQNDLSTFINIEAVPQAELVQRVSSGDYQLALISLRSDSNSPSAVLNSFKTSSTKNMPRYYSQQYDSILDSVAAINDSRRQAEAFARAEALILSDAAVIPFAKQHTYYITRKNVEDIYFSPYGGIIFFKYAKN
jgi:oligopeptide transport system substrate-binding protein